MKKVNQIGKKKENIELGEECHWDTRLFKSFYSGSIPVSLSTEVSMTSKFDGRDRDRTFPSEENEMRQQNSRFELLSAYLDGEVTPSERKHIQEWLDSDPKMQRLYTQLLRLRQEIPHLPIPAPEQSAEQLSESVFQTIDRRRNAKRGYFWGGVAIAAVVIGALSHFLVKHDSPMPQMAQTPATPSAEPLMIALNHPAVEIPPLLEEKGGGEGHTEINGRN